MTYRRLVLEHLRTEGEIGNFLCGGAAGRRIVLGGFEMRRPLEFLLVFLVLLARQSLHGQDPFVRGDVDGDGDLTLADAVRMARAIALRSPLPCADAADFSDNGFVQLGDLALLVEFLRDGSPAPPAPFPQPGVDATGDALDCGQVGAPPPVRDAGDAYALSVGPASASSRDVALSVAVANGVPVRGGELEVEISPRWAEDARVVALRPSLELALSLPASELDDSFIQAALDGDGVLHIVWWLSIFDEERLLAAGESRPLLAVTLCPASSPAGDYDLRVLRGELVSAAGERLAAGGNPAPTALGEPDGVACVPEVPEWSDVRARVWIGDAQAWPGGTFRVPFYAMSSQDAFSFTCIVVWDPDLLEIRGAEQVSDVGYVGGSLRNFDGESGPGRQDVWHEMLDRLRICDPCYATGGRFQGPSATMRVSSYDPGGEPRWLFPEEREYHFFDLIFTVRESVEAEEAWIDFYEDPGTLGPFSHDNAVRLCPNRDEMCNLNFQARPLVAGRVEILPAPPGTGFLRGDANLDGQLGMSDAITLLFALFGGAASPLKCPDAADANDDGRLDVSDAISVLGYLFLGGPRPPPPFPEPGEDPTADLLRCDAT
jgi:hypothetical protein